MESRSEGWLQHQPSTTLGVAPLIQLGSKGGAKESKKKLYCSSFSCQASQKSSWTRSQYKWKSSLHSLELVLLRSHCSPFSSTFVPCSFLSYWKLLCPTPSMNSTFNPLGVNQGQLQAQPQQLQFLRESVSGGRKIDITRSRFFSQAR